MLKDETLDNPVDEDTSRKETIHPPKGGEPIFISPKDNKHEISVNWNTFCRNYYRSHNGYAADAKESIRDKVKSDWIRLSTYFGPVWVDDSLESVMSWVIKGDAEKYSRKIKEEGIEKWSAAFVRPKGLTGKRDKTAFQVLRLPYIDRELGMVTLGELKVASNKANIRRQSITNKFHLLKEFEKAMVKGGAKDESDTVERFVDLETVEDLYRKYG